MPLITTILSGAGLYPGCSRFLPTSLFPVSPKTTYSFSVTASAARIGVRGPSSQTPSASQRPAGCVGSGLGLCSNWGSLILWYRGPGRVSGPPPIIVSDPGWRYAPMIGFRFASVTVTNSQLNTFGPWKRFNYMLQPWGQSRTTSHTPSCAPPAAVMLIGKHNTSW